MGLTNRGFTLTEVLIALAITGFLTLTTFPFLLRLYDYLKLNQALMVLEADLHYVRNFNMVPRENERMTLRIFHEENRYVLLVGDVVQDERVLPRNISILGANPTTNIRFNEAGNLGMGRTLHVESNYYSRRVVFAVGIGGFEIRK